MACSFQMDAELLTRSRSLIDETRRLKATHQNIQTILKDNHEALVASSRACIAESKRLLARLAIEIPTAAIKPNPAEVRTRPDRNPAMLSVRVVEDGLRFGWSIHTPTKEVLGRGTAETEFDARVEAFRAAMDYINQLKGRSELKISTLH